MTSPTLRPVVPPLALSCEQLRPASALPFLNFTQSDELAVLEGVLGQERAKASMAFGTSITTQGYNIYVMGDSGSGRTRFVREHLAPLASAAPQAQDWIYVNNFLKPIAPLAIALPGGEAQALRLALMEAINDMISRLTSAFEHPAYQQQKNHLDTDFNRRFDEAVLGVEDLAAAQELALYRDAGTFGFTPMQDGQALTEAEFAALTDEKRQWFHKAMKDMEAELNTALLSLSQWRRELSLQHRDHIQQQTQDALAPVFDQLNKDYQQHPAIVDYLKAMRAHLVTEVVENCVDEQSFDMRLDRLQKSMMEEAYLPNVFVSAALDCDAVDAEPTPGAPVIYEANPTHRNLMGHIDYISEQGVLVTNHQHLFAGALHKANGGYLILDAEKLLTDANAWNALKRALKSHQIGVESLAVEQSLVTTPSMSPQLLPLAVKIILIGARDIYYLLQQFDNDFPEMFRVLVDFDEFITRDESTVLEFARVLQCHCHTLGLPVLHQGAVDALLDYSSRLVEHQRRLSARFRLVFELLDEAALCCRQQAAKVITREHISEALRSREQRNNRISQRLLEEMLSGTLVVRSDGEAIGELNGLTVMDLAEHRIGAPARISATAYPGSRGVIDIEREVALGQAVHSKGVMLLTGYLGNAYAVDVPLCLSAHIAMEQSYGYIDGDSASMAEACCLLSAIARIPLRQSLAVTGSLNQHGEVQAVGGVNEKIEGYFALCQRRGLDGQQGVIIPASNISNLVLAEPVLAAVDQGLFHIYAVSTINQALALLVNQEVGEADAEGHYPEQSFNHMVVAQLQAWWHKAQIKL